VSSQHNSATNAQIIYQALCQFLSSVPSLKFKPQIEPFPDLQAARRDFSNLPVTRSVRYREIAFPHSTKKIGAVARYPPG
jgi:hypothetical protein